MYKRILTAISCAMVISACAESRDSASLTGPQFVTSTNEAGCKGEDFLVKWHPGVKPDKNGDGAVCVDASIEFPTEKDYYDNVQTLNDVGCMGSGRLIPWEIGAKPDKNADGFVCAETLIKEEIDGKIYDNVLFADLLNEQGCYGKDVLFAWEIGAKPDKNADGFVCAGLVSKDPTAKDFYDNQLLGTDPKE